MVRPLIALIIALTFMMMPVRAQDDDARNEAFALPPAEWYAVVWHPPTDTLHWVNSGGTVASIPRPRLIGEPFGSQPQMHVSPDGRTLLLVADLVSGRQGIAFYDIVEGRFVQTHETQSGETISFGGRYIGRGENVALGFSTPESGAWRVIVFNYRTGDPVAILNHNDAIAVVAPRSGIRAPQVVYHGIDRELNAPAVHFQLNAADNTTPSAAFAWYPADGSLTPSPYGGDGDDFRYSDAARLFTFTDRTRPIQNANNAVGRGDPVNPQLIYVDDLTVKSSPRWLAGGNWIGYFASGESVENWQVIPLNVGQPVPQITLASNVRDLVGTPGGYLAARTNGTVTFTADLNALDGVIVFRPPPDSAEAVPQIISVTPEGVSPALNQVRIPAPPEPFAVVVPVCPGAPPPRLLVGELAQVIGEAPLRVRTVAGGEIVTDMQVGTVGEVIGGTQCVNGYLWWVLRWRLPDGRIIEGWSAEGDLDEYFLQVVQVAPDPDPTPIAPMAPPQIPAPPDAPFAPPTLPPDGG